MFALASTEILKWISTLLLLTTRASVYNVGHIYVHLKPCESRQTCYLHFVGCDIGCWFSFTLLKRSFSRCVWCSTPFLLHTWICCRHSSNISKVWNPVLSSCEVHPWQDEEGNTSEFNVPLRCDEAHFEMLSTALTFTWTHLCRCSLFNRVCSVGETLTAAWAPFIAGYHKHTWIIHIKRCPRISLSASQHLSRFHSVSRRLQWGVKDGTAAAKTFTLKEVEKEI